MIFREGGDKETMMVVMKMMMIMVIKIMKMMMNVMMVMMMIMTIVIVCQCLLKRHFEFTLKNKCRRLCEDQP